MKIKYSKPTTKVILIKGGQHLLVDSAPTGIQSTMSGYSPDESEDSGFTQNEN